MKKGLKIAGNITGVITGLLMAGHGVFAVSAAPSEQDLESALARSNPTAECAEYGAFPAWKIEANDGTVIDKEEFPPYKVTSNVIGEGQDSELEWISNHPVAFTLWKAGSGDPIEKLGGIKGIVPMWMEKWLSHLTACYYPEDPTNTPLVTNTYTPIPSETPLPSLTPSETPLPSLTPSNTPIVSLTASYTPLSSLTATPYTMTPIVTETGTITLTPTIIGSATWTMTPEVTASLTPTAINTPEDPTPTDSGENTGFIPAQVMASEIESLASESVVMPYSVTPLVSLGEIVAGLAIVGVSGKSLYKNKKEQF